MAIIWENGLFFVEQEPHDLPWLKIVAKRTLKELSECSALELKWMLEIAMCIEKSMLEFYAPDKINHASFGNKFPQVHWHVQARFKNDDYFPEPLWGQKQRNGNLLLPNFCDFADIVTSNLQKLKI